MKAVILILAFSFMTALCFGVVQFNLGVDLVGNHNVDLSWEGLFEGSSEDDYDVSTGISPSFEYMLKSGSFYYGLGAEYQVQRDAKFNDGKDKFGFIPLYGVLRYQFPASVQVIPEITAQAGYNFFTADDDYKGDGTLTGGLYWGVGAGFAIYKNYILQAMYKTNTGTLKQEILGTDHTADITNTQISISLGYRM